MPLTRALPPLRDVRASIVVFLVALPLCLGVAVASGVPPELGLVTGIIGGLVVGFLPGSRVQVSGPAAGLTVLVFAMVQDHGIEVLGPVVLAAGVLQLALAAVRVGGWFRAMAYPVVHGMLAGIGLLIIASQALVLVGAKSTGEGLGDIQELPGAISSAISFADGPTPTLAVGLIGLAILIAWKLIPALGRAVPGPLVAVVGGASIVALLEWEAQKIQLPPNLADAITLPTLDSLSVLSDPAILGVAIALGLVASAESLLSAVAVDRMHGGEPTKFNRELAAQGVGNTVAGGLGALPLTAVIVRSAANVEAGATTKASRVLHGWWLLLFAAALPGLLSLIPTSVLAAVLVMAGVALVSPGTIRSIRAEGNGELVLFAITALAVFSLGLLEGVLVGLALAAIRLLISLAKLDVRRVETADGQATELVLNGPATFLAVPQLAQTLDAVPDGEDVRVDLHGVPMADPAARDVVHGWRERHEDTGATVHLDPPEAMPPVGPGGH